MKKSNNKEMHDNYIAFQEVENKKVAHLISRTIIKSQIVKSNEQELSFNSKIISRAIVLISVYYYATLNEVIDLHYIPSVVLHSMRF